MKTAQENRFGRLTKKAEFTKGRRPHWLCVCDCGKEIIVVARSVKKGFTKSCGCLRIELFTSHGLSNTSEYKAWISMKARCKNPQHKSAKHYHDKGITVCERWESFELFYKDMGPKPTKKHTLERLDNNQGYSPDNCKWATYAEQTNNTSRNNKMFFDGAILTMAQLARRFNVKESTFRATLWRQVRAGAQLDEQAVRKLAEMKGWGLRTA